MTVWLGAPDPSWITGTDTPLFVSHSRLRRLSPAGLPFAPPGHRWALDSGAYSFVTTLGGFPDSPAAYVAAVARYDSRIGGLAWASIQDMMTEDDALAATGLTVEAHQLASVRSYVDCTALWDQRPRLRPSPFRAALQGKTPEDYIRCARFYTEHGVDLAAADIVGLGSICRRSNTREIAEVVSAVLDAVPDIRLHGYGVKLAGLKLYGKQLASIDSMAWSYAAKKQRIKGSRCTQFHATCQNCLEWALEWHELVSARHDAARGAGAAVPSPACRPAAGRRIRAAAAARNQLALFADDAPGAA